MIEEQAETFFNDRNQPYTYIKELENNLGLRKIKIKFQKPFIISIFIFIALQIVLMIVGLLLLRFTELKVLFSVMMIPFMIVFLFIPSNAICIFDYNAKTFSSHPVGIIPVPLKCFSSVFVNFCDISGFYLKKFTKYGKRSYNVGIKLNDGSELTILAGQNTQGCPKKNQEVDEINFIPFVLRKFLKPGEQNIL